MKAIYLNLILILVIALAIALAFFLNSEKINCEDYCSEQPHVMCIGNWNVSGEYPNCSCEFVCNVEEIS